MDEPETAYQREYSEERFRTKLARFAVAAGREVTTPALTLFYALENEKVPRWARATIYGALGYFILPTDAIVDLTPVVGYSDDLGVLTAALAAVALYTTPEAKERAREKTNRIFSSRDDSTDPG